jgi:hypothetical protein
MKLFTPFFVILKVNFDQIPALNPVGNLLSVKNQEKGCPLMRRFYKLINRLPF